MKLTHITISNFLGARDVQIDAATPVTLVCGPNGSGKSSVRDALDLALTGALHRVALKKDAGALVTEGAQKARISVAGQDLAVEVAISAAGKMARSGASVDALPALLPYVLDGQRFARGLTPDGRRQFLFGLMGVKIDGPAVAKRLDARGCHAGRVAHVLPSLRSGFDAACSEAKGRATLARGAWKAVTGEAYGSQKAEGWRAAVPGQAVDGEPTDPALLKACDVALESWQRSMGAAAAERERRAGQKRRLPDLQATADLLPRRLTKLAADEAELGDVQGQLQRAREAAGAVPRERVGLIHDLAAAVAYLLPLAQTPMDREPPQAERDAETALVAYEREHGRVGEAYSGDPEARAKLPALGQALSMCERTVANSRRDVDAAQRAAAELATITADLAQPMADTSEAEAQIARLKSERAAITARIEAAASVKRAHEAAQRKTTEAAGHHADVQAWEQIAEALAPSGIPAELLSEALTPLNDALRLHAESSQWPQVVVSDDMSILMARNKSGTAWRAYALLSESEQWRADAMLAAAIAQLSEVRLLVLDRFDVLDQQGRSDALYWLDDLASAGDIDTALVFGTLARAPSGLPDNVRAVWIEGGRARGSGGMNIAQMIRDGEPAVAAAVAVLVDPAIQPDLWRCTVCGRTGTVGRCCGEETREPVQFKMQSSISPLTAQPPSSCLSC